MSSSSFGTSLSLDNTRGREGTQTRKIRSDPSVARTGVMHGVQGANKKVKVQLDDFQLIRVLGTGCAGRVRLTPVVSCDLTGSRSYLSNIPPQMPSAP